MEKKKYEYACIRRKVGDKYIKFYGKTKREAQNKYLQALKEHVDIKASPSMTLDIWANKWLETYKYGTVQDITYYNTYENPTRNHIIPYFKGKRIGTITPPDIQAFIKSKITYSKSTLDNLLLCLKGMFKTAVQLDLINRNPTIDLRLPPIVKDRPLTEREAWSYEQGRLFIDWAKTHEYGLDGILPLKTGVRRAELLAIPTKLSKKTGGYSLSENLLQIRQSLSESKSGVSINPCKTKKSRRDIPFDTELCDLIKEQDMYIRYSKSSYKKDFLIAGRFGGYIIPSNWDSRRFNKLMDDYETYCAESDIKVSRLSAHELRHSFGSILYEKTKDIVVVSNLMGHSSIEITAKIYIHQDMSVKRKAIELGV